MKRRDFLICSATALTSSAAFAGPVHAVSPVPLRAIQSVRRLSAKRRPYGDYLLVSDGSTSPRPLIRKNAIERVFGAGVFETLAQPDHWRMVVAGWFGDHDLFKPQPSGDPAYVTWCATYKPEIEAFDLLMDVFGDRVECPVGLEVPEFCLTLAEHPCTPRYAIATIDDPSVLPALAAYVASQTEWVSINPVSELTYDQPRRQDLRHSAGIAEGDMQ